MNQLLIIIFLYSVNVFAAQWASVTSDKAVIYADRELSSPIGFISKGKRIRVGEKTRRGGKVLPIVIRKKVAYIKVSDISTSVKLEQLQSASARIKQTEIKEDDKRIGLFYSGFASFISIPEEEAFNGETNAGELFYHSGFGLRGYISQRNSKKTWRVSLELSSTTTKLNNYTMISLTPEFGYDFIKFDNYTFRLYGGVPITPFSQYSYDSLFTVNGYGAGVSVGAEMDIKFKNSFGLHVDAGYRYSKLFFTLPEDTNVGDSNPSFYGLSFSATLSYAY